MLCCALLRLVPDAVPVLCCSSNKLYEGSSGVLLANDRTRTLLHGIHNGYLSPSQHHHSHSHHGSSSHSSHSSRPEQQQQQDPQQQPLEQKQQQHSPSVGMFGISTLAFLASQVAGGMRQQAAQQKQQRADSEARAAEAAQFEEQHPERAIPKSRMLVPDIPSGSLVLALNLGAYWMITRQARRSSMGGTVTG